MASSNPDASAVPSPLQDHTNTRIDRTELDEKDEEIARLTSLVKGLTKKRGRGRKRAGDNAPDDEDPKPAKKAKKSSTQLTPESDYAHYGRIVGRLLGPFEDVAQIIEYGTSVDSAMEGDEPEHDAALAEAYLILWQKFPGFREFLLKLTNQPIVRRAVERQMNAGMEAVRAEDTSTLKPRVHLYVNEDPTVPLDPPLSNLKLKIYRGRNHPVFARLLNPMYWAANETTYREIAEGTKVVDGTQLPIFVFPLNQVFPVGAKEDDPVWLDVLDNACKGEICLRSAKAIYMGPDSALEGDGYHKGRPGKASIIGLKTFTRRVIAGVITQIHFSMSSKQDWHKKDGDFDYEVFFWTIYNLFDDEEWAEETIALWNRVVLGTVKPRAPAAPQPAGPSHLEQLKAMRATKKREAAATTTSAAAAAAANSADTANGPGATPVDVPAGSAATAS
ncbi:hypothetical protein MVEN_00724800 [Mycena venus]|uniref:Uncharacterized protein n=1 Tax=Mycena venus TaxID=2733690 RepID=A0A8H7D2S4_9AGAR|nr:hypothetical protein MVEN_00724800 [Mycena venus]